MQLTFQFAAHYSMMRAPCRYRAGRPKSRVRLGPRLSLSLSLPLSLSLLIAPLSFLSSLFCGQQKSGLQAYYSVAPSPFRSTPHHSSFPVLSPFLPSLYSLSPLSLTSLFLFPSPRLSSPPLNPLCLSFSLSSLLHQQALLSSPLLSSPLLSSPLLSPLLSSFLPACPTTGSRSDTSAPNT